MKKSGIISIIIASVLVVIGVTLGLIFGLKKDKTKNDLYITIEAEDKIYDGEALMVNVLSSQDTTFEIFYKSHDAHDEEYSAVAPIKVGNYDIKVVATRENKNLTEETQVSILPKELYIDGLDINSKVYDGNKEIEFDNELLLNGVVKDDDVILNYDDLVISFDNAEVEDNKNVSISGLLIEGEDIGNYELKIPSIRADILPREVIVEGISVKDKIFDGTTEAEIEGNIALNGLLENETKVSFAGELKANFEYSEVGENIKIIFSGLSLTGDNAKNYILIYPEIYANITEKPHYIVNYSVNNEEYGYIEGDLTQEIEQGENCSIVTAIANEGFKFIKWSDGLTSPSRTDKNILSSKNITAIFAKDVSFDFINNVSDVIIDSVASIDDNGYIQVAVDDTLDSVTTLTDKLDLLIEDSWTLTTEFQMNSVGNNGLFTILGVKQASSTSDAYALQIDTNRLRIYMAGEAGYNFKKPLSLNKDYRMTLSSDGSGNLSIVIEEIDGNIEVINDTFEYVASTNYVVHCDVIGNSFFGSSNQNSSGVIYSLHIEDNSSQEPEEEVIIKYQVNSDEMGYISGETTQIIKFGESGNEVEAIANEGYRFVRWSDGVKTAKRSESNVRKSITITAYFEKIIDVSDFEFVNNFNEISVSTLPNLTEEGYLEIGMSDNLEKTTTLSDTLILRKTDAFTISSKFRMEQFSGEGFISFFGTKNATGGDDAFALQINQNLLRIYMGGEFRVGLDTTLQLNTDYIFKLTSYGNQNILLQILLAEDQSEVVNKNFVYDTETDYIVNCNTIGNTFYMGTNQNGAGRIYYIHLEKGEVIPPETQTYNLNYTVNDASMGRIEGQLSQKVEEGNDGTTVIAVANEGFKFVKWSDGILDSERTDRKVNRNISVQAIFEKEKIDVNTFDFENSFNDVIVDSSSRIDENGYIQVTLEDNDENVTILNETLTLLPSQKWTIESKFKITYLQGEKYYFTFLGVLEGNDVKDIYALQVSQKALRIYAGGKDNEYILQNDLSFDKEYIFSLSCDGLNALVLNITDAFTQEKIVENQIIEYDGDKVVNANVIGNSIYLGGNQCSEGTIYYLHINNVYQCPENPGGEKFTLTYKVNNEEYGYIEGNSIQIVKKGLNGETVTAKANAGYRFVKWDDEKMSAQRLDENITENKIITAIFEPVSSVESFDFINEVSDIKIENPMSVDENGIIQVSMNDTQSDVTTLSGKLVLKTNEIWTMETKFKMTELKDGDWYFTFLGTYVAGTAEEVFALQINTTTFRIYMGTNNGFDFYPLDKTLELNKEYTLTLSCDGKQNLTLNIVDSKEVTVIENQVINFTSSEYVSNCDVIGNSFYHTGETVINQGSAGEIYYLHIKKD